jgi:tetratricopeptide (TPR) repeat protein
LNREMGESDAALKNFNAVIRKNPGAYHAWYYAGEEYQNLGDNKQAESCFSKITDIQVQRYAANSASRADYFPLSAYAKFQLARIYSDTERIDMAEKSLQDIILNYRSFGPAYRLLGNVYSMKGDNLLSDRYTIRANDLAIYAPPVDTLIDKLSLLSRSELYLLKRIDEAEKSVYPEWAMKLVNSAIIYIPEDKYLISKAIHLYLIMNLGKLALPYLDKHFGYFQQDFNEIRSVADLLFTMGFYSQSMTYYEQALKLKPEETDIEPCIALCLWNVGKKQQTLVMMNEFLENDKGNLKILTDGVNLLLNVGEKEKARLYLDKLKRIAPSDPTVQKLSGMIAEDDGNKRAAAALYESAFNANPGDLSTTRYLVSLLMQQKMWAKCINCLRKALEYHPNEPYLLERLGTLLVSCPDPRMRNIKEGKEFSERAFIHTTSQSATLISAGRSLAIAYAALGDKQNAYNIMSMTVNLAKREHVPASFQEGLEKMLQQFSR